MPLLDPIPSPVENADLAALEWEPLLQLVGGFSASPSAARPFFLCGHRRRKSGSRASISLPAKCVCCLPSRFPSPSAACLIRRSWSPKSRIPDAALEAAELQSIARLANDIAAWQALLQSPPARLVGRLAGLSALSDGLTINLRPLAESIERKIQPDGTLADDASPELGRIRREQERQQRQIEESLRAALRKLSSDGATQDDLITIRGDRFVIPVRSELKRRVSGVVHGASSSGQTVYVEPLETIEQNNELVRLIEEEQAEIHRIFVALTRQVGSYADALDQGARVLAHGRQPAGARALRAGVRVRRARNYSGSSASRIGPASAA